MEGGIGGFYLCRSFRPGANRECSLGRSTIPHVSTGHRAGQDLTPYAHPTHALSTVPCIRTGHCVGQYRAPPRQALCEYWTWRRGRVGAYLSRYVSGSSSTLSSSANARNACTAALSPPYAISVPDMGQRARSTRRLSYHQVPSQYQNSIRWRTPRQYRTSQTTQHHTPWQYASRSTIRYESTLAYLRAPPPA